MSRSLVIVALVGIMMISFALQGVDAKVTKVYEHMFAKSIENSSGGDWTPWKPVNVTNTFDQDDEIVWAVTKASFGLTNFTWHWYSPGGALYRTDKARWSCIDAWCIFADRLLLRDRDAAGKLG